MPVDASHIPIELHDLILDFLTIRSQSHHASGNIVEANKRDLGSCALVCRWWRPVCHAKMFRVITLRSRQDLLFLLSLATNPYSIAAPNVQWIRAIQSGCGAPWVHLLCAKILQGGQSPGFPSYQYHTLEFEGPEPLPRHFVRTGVHALLPTQLPAFSAGVAKLVLSHLTLPGVSTIVRLAEGLPSLEFLVCNSLSWTIPPEEDESSRSITRRRRISARSETIGLQMNNCADDCAAVLIGGAFLGGHAFKLHLQQEDYLSMRRLAHAITKNISREEHPEYATFCNLSAHVSPVTLSFLVESDPYSIAAPSLNFKFQRDIATGSAFIEAIEVVFRPNDSLMISVADVVHFDWEGFDLHTKDLSNLRVVIFGFSSREDVKVFVNEVEPRLHNLLQADRVRYGVWKREGVRSRWVASESGKSPREQLNVRAGARGVGLYELFKVRA